MTEREAFEAWFTSQHGAQMLMKAPDGEYAWLGAQDWWKVWKASRKQAVAEGTFDDGVQALAGHMRMRAANNWHGRPAADAMCKQENALIEEWLRDALAEIAEERSTPRL